MILIIISFHPWHGLDLLIDNCKSYIRKRFKKNFDFSFDKLDSNYLDQIKIINQSNKKIKFKVYGTLKQKKSIGKFFVIAI